MTEPLAETWTTRELPVLREALKRKDSGDMFVDLEGLRAHLEMTGDQMYAAMDSLSHATPPYIDVTLTMGWSEGRASGHIDRVYERARRELGTWPTADNLVAEIAAALSRAADETTEPEERSRLRAAAEALSGFARDVAVAVVSRHVGG